MTTVSGAEQDRAQRSVREWVEGQGARLRNVAPKAVMASLVAAACAPVVWPLVGVHESVQAVVGLLAGTGSGYIGAFIEDRIERLRRASTSEAELREALEQELVGELETNAGLRADAAALLRSMLHSVQEEQARHGAELRHQTDLSREALAKINRMLRLLTPSPEPTVPDRSGEPALPEGAEPAPGPCPYMGLAAFQAEDAQWFFGREQLVAQLVARLAEAPFLAVVGPSGSGKSSALRAGLLPAVWAGTLPGASGWKTLVLTPGARPLEELAIRVALECRIASGSLLADLRAKPENLRLAVRQALLDEPVGAKLLLVVDQFEELFTLGAAEPERRSFVQALTSLDSVPVTVVVGVRADFYARCAEYPELVAAMQDRQVLVGPMTGPELREAIEGPAARASLTLEPGLTETILADLGDEPGSLPLLSHALWATWQRRRGRVLTVAGYRDAGGVRKAIGQTAEEVYGDLGPAQQGIAKDVFLRLTALGEGTADTRRRAARAELRDGRDVDVVLDRLAQARLVILDDDTVEVAHEALIREWPTLRGWLTENREGLRTHRRLTEAAVDWEALERDPGALYRGGRLVTARDWAVGHEDRLNLLEREFLTASNKREHAEQAAVRNRRLRILTAIVVVLSLVAVQQWRTIQQQIDRATAQQLNAGAITTIDQQPLSLLLSLESLRVASTGEARDNLLRGLLDPRHNVTTLTGSTGLVWGVAFSPDGEIIASVSEGRTVRLWDATSGAPIGEPLTGHTEAVVGVVFSPDGATIASASWDGTVRLWDAVTGAPLGQPLTGHTAAVRGVVFSPRPFRLHGSHWTTHDVAQPSHSTLALRQNFEVTDLAQHWRQAARPHRDPLVAVAQNGGGVRAVRQPLCLFPRRHLDTLP